MYRLLRAMGSLLSRYLNRQTLGAYPHPAADLALMSQILKPADVVLVEGKRRISTAIKYLTQYSWSHARIYVGGCGGLDAEGRVRAFVEADMEKGVRAFPIEELEGLHLRDLGGDTLDKLDVYIAHCDAVVHLAGDMTGSDPGEHALNALRAKYPDLADKLPPLGEALRNGSGVSYTQWEAWLALYHGKLLFIAKAADSAERGPKYMPTDASRAAQATHLARLEAMDRHPGCTFTSPDNLAKHILSSAILDLLVKAQVVAYAEELNRAGDAADGFIHEIAQKVAGDRNLDLEGKKLAIRNAIDVYAREIAGGQTQTNYDVIVEKALSTARSQVDAGWSGLARATLRRASEALRQQEEERLEHYVAEVTALGNRERDIALAAYDGEAAGDAIVTLAEALHGANAALLVGFLNSEATTLYEYGKNRGSNVHLAALIVLRRKLLALAASDDERGRAHNNLGRALFRLGERGERNWEASEEAAAAYRAALEGRTPERVPLDWATTKNNLGNALRALGERESGTGKLEEAVAAYRAALEERTRERVPLAWATTKNNLGSALFRLGERESGTARLEEAVAAYRAALEERTRERVPLDWATTKNNLGSALFRLGERESGTARLEEAVAAYRAALEERTRERAPLDWAMTQNNLGIALWKLGERESGTARVEEAVAAYRSALEEYTRERVPLAWAMTQNNLGIAFRALGERESGTGKLEEAVAAYCAALEERTLERVPLDWAATKNHLGSALFRLGERESGTARLEEAVATYRAALEERTRESVPLDWAQTQNNLGIALKALGDRESGTARLDEAVAAYHAALEERTRDRVPLDWAQTQNDLGIALRALGERKSAIGRLENAVTAYPMTIEERTLEPAPQYRPDPKRVAERIASRIEQRASPNDRTVAWQEKAAVLTSFRPTMIDSPANAEQRLADEEWIAFLSDTEPMLERHGGARQLRLDVRQAVLTRLGPAGWKRARASVKEVLDEPQQRMLDAVLAGALLNLDGLERPELDALLVISRWIGAIVPTLPSVDAVADRIARIDLLDPLKRMTKRFVGREEELDDLRSYVEEISAQNIVRRFAGFIGNRFGDLVGRKALLIYGPAGVGKSTLIARFLLEHAASSLPFIYIDLDRPSIDPRNQFIILKEAARQLALQVPRIRPAEERFSIEIDQILRERASSEASRSAHQLGESVPAFCRLVQDALPAPRRLPFVIDTFEEAQAIGDEALLGVTRLVLLMLTTLPRIRPIISGRVPIDRNLLGSDPVELRGFEPLQAIEFLQQLLARYHHLNVDAATLDPVVKALSGTPLSLSRAAQVIADEGADAVPKPGFLARLLHLTDDAELYSRVLDHLKDSQLHALAKPGLVVRRLTPAIVREVLAEPCGLAVANDAQAEDLLTRLAKTISLVQREPDGSLMHRSDVRRQMLPRLERDVGSDKIRQIDTAAARFYRDAVPTDPIPFAERLYHLLRLDEIATVNELWADKEATEAAVSRLRGAVEELRPASRRALKLRLNIPLASEERSAAGLDEWEIATERAVRALLTDGEFATAAKYLSERQQRLKDSRLPLVEVEVHSGLRDWKRVIDIARPAADAAADRGAPHDAFALFLAASRACEATGDRSAALKALESAETQARRTGDVELLLRVAATRTRLSAQSGTAPDSTQLQRDVVTDLHSSGALDRLTGAALREVAAAFGNLDPSLIRAALYRLGLPLVTPAMIYDLSALISRLTAGDGAQAMAALEVFRSLRPKEITGEKMELSQWQAFLANLPGLDLGRALAELIGCQPPDPGLISWAQEALKARVQRDVMGDSASAAVA